MRIALLVLLPAVAFVASTAHSQSFCPLPIAERPFSATWVETTDQGLATTASAAKIQIARGEDGSTRCGRPQSGRPPSQIHLVDMAHGREIFYGCAEIATDPRRGLVAACEGQSVTVRPWPSRFLRLTAADVELRLQNMAGTLSTRRSEGTVVKEMHVIGQRLIHDALCVGFQETRQGTEPVIGGANQAQPVDRTYEEWISPLYGVMETSSVDRVRNTHTHGSFQPFLIGEPAPELLVVPPAYKDTLVKAIAASPQTVSIPEPAR